MQGIICLSGHAYCRECDYENLILAYPSLTDQLTPVDEVTYAFYMLAAAAQHDSTAFEELAKQAFKEPERKFHCRICGKTYMFRQGAKECERNHRRSIRGR